MLQSFIIVLREGFESFLLVAVIFSYLRRSGQKKLSSAVYAAIIAAVGISGALGYLLFQMQTGNADSVEKYFGARVAGFLGNEALREAVLGTVAIVMVASLVIYMWRTGPKLKEKMEERLGEVSARRSGWIEPITLTGNLCRCMGPRRERRFTVMPAAVQASSQCARSEPPAA